MAQERGDKVPDGYEVVYCRYITTRSGKRLPPPAGKKAWRLLVKIGGRRRSG